MQYPVQHSAQEETHRISAHQQKVVFDGNMKRGFFALFLLKCFKIFPNQRKQQEQQQTGGGQPSQQNHEAGHEKGHVVQNAKERPQFCSNIRSIIV